MITQNDILADFHTHSIASLHGYSTIKENLEAARKRNLKFLINTDHYYGCGDEIQQKNEVARIIYMENVIKPTDIRLISSAEFNLSQDILAEHLKKLSKLTWKPMGYHSWFQDKNITLDKLYLEFVNGYQKYNYTAFCHIERELIKQPDGNVDETGLNTSVCEFLRKIVDFAFDNNIYLEVNESSLITNEKNARNRMLYWLKYAKEKGNMLYLGTDAHWCELVGKFENTINILNEVKYNKNLILNCRVDILEKMF